MQEAAAQQQSLLALKKKQYEVKFDLDGTRYLPIENIGTGESYIKLHWVPLTTSKMMQRKMLVVSWKTALVETVLVTTRV